jgi:Ni,Fe-hydrogenase maturation factor
MEGSNLEFLFVLQLTPELSEVIKNFERVCFIDAHTGSVPGEVNQVEVNCEFQASPFTHHLTAATCLALTHALYGQCPQSILVSVRGYEFGFDTTLSTFTSSLVDEAAWKILSWLETPEGIFN